MAANPVTFFRNVSQELKKVTWPTKRETVVSMIMVFIMVTFIATFLFIVDQVAGAGIKWILG
jgi:preprotein translocase subunit SecE